MLLLASFEVTSSNVLLIIAISMLNSKIIEKKEAAVNKTIIMANSALSFSVSQSPKGNSPSEIRKRFQRLA